ncbi:lanthionine synthetase LanC family protein [Nonomuraea sp. NPDC049269]|uniref:lanthionine synthetase LanC family protein n=1 Tax=Nonomuraea sp. NPDC049269 TaxID=3364349 RepID=UPI003715E050
MNTLIAVCARQVAGQVADARLRRRALATLARVTAKRQANTWSAAGLSMGDAGLGLMSAAFADRFPDTGWEALGQEFLAAGLDQARAPDATLSLFSGTVGYATAAWQPGLGAHRASFLPFEDRLLARMGGFAQGLAADERPAPRGYDTVTGISGWCGYLRGRAGSKQADRVTASVADALVAVLSEDGLPRLSYRFRQGEGARLVDCGLAHGVAGPLAALSLLERHHRFQRPDVETAIHWGARWLMAQAGAEGGVVLWPDAVELDPSGSSDRPRVNAGSWCHGGSGIARALYLAGAAVGAPRYQEFAVDAFLTHCALPPWLPSPNLCHGTAGQLLITLAFAHDTDQPAFRHAVQRLVGELFNRYRSDSLLGYLDVEDNGVAVDHPGLLRGAAGVALALLSAAAGEPLAWSRLLLID